MKNNSVPYINGYVNIKSSESVVTERENSLGQVAQTRKTTAITYIVNKADISNMSKTKNLLHLMLIRRMPDTLEKHILSYFMVSRDRRNMVLDTRHRDVITSKFLATLYSTTTRSVNRVLQILIDDDLIRKLNKYQIMMNPYLIVDNHMRLGLIEELQVWWDSKPTTPVVWLPDQDADDTLMLDLTKIQDNIIARKEDAKNVALIKAENDANDIALIGNAIPTLYAMVKFHQKHPLEFELSHIRNFIAKKHKELCLTSLKPIKELIARWELVDAGKTAKSNSLN